MGQPSRTDALPSWMKLVLGALVGYRIVYHSAYLREVPFALATFSDGRRYEAAALDILAAPPLGTEAFYLQGVYAYFMAVPMSIRPWVSLALLLQLVVAGLAIWGFFRAAAHWYGRRGAAVATMVLLAYPGLAFYENKFLTGELAVVTSIAVVLSVARAQRRPGDFRLCVVGGATGLAVLARPNAAVAMPFVAWAVAEIARATGRRRARALVPWALGVVLVLAPMSLRNLAVTGSPTVFPAHGGGTSFYIGNNRHARGVWNDAGGLFSGDVGRERAELAARLGIEADSAARESAAVGRALYRRGIEDIAADPMAWLWLEARKLWLLLGNDELTQDYDWYGEREMLPWAHRLPMPFGVLMALGCMGAWVLRRRIRCGDGSTSESSGVEARREDPRPLAWTLCGLVVAVLAANLVYFTSSQHRLPLVVPLAMLAGLGAPALARIVRALAAGAGDRRQAGRQLAGVLAIVVAALVPRAKARAPSAVHDYNLAIAWQRLGVPGNAALALDRAVARRPGHALIRLERATLRRKRGAFRGAREDLRAIEDLEAQPGWVRHAVDRERELLNALVGEPRPAATPSRDAPDVESQAP